MNFSKIKYFPEAVFLIILLFLSCGGIEDLYNKVSKSSVEISDEETEYFRVTYNGNGNETGNVPVDENSYKEGDSFTVQGNPGTLALTGYSFNGWNIQSNGDGDFYDENYSFTIGSSDVTFFAQWLAARWAKTVTASSSNSQINSVSVDSSGNVYAAGIIVGITAVDFGNGISTAGMYPPGDNILLVKYNSSGSAQWATSLVSGSNTSFYKSVSVDSSGNVYAAGALNGSGSCGFGNSVTTSGAYAGGSSILLVKYSSSGSAQWAKSIVTGTSNSFYRSAAVSSSDNIYAAGEIYSTSVYGFDSGVTVQGANSGNNVLLSKYNTSGDVLWAKSVESASSTSSYYSVGVDSSENVYAAGVINQNSAFNFGDGITAAGGFSASGNLILVKYSSEGTTLWARSVESATGVSGFYGVSLDSEGNIYGAGYIGQGVYSIGNGVTLDTSSMTSNNILLVKYNSAGTVQWAKTMLSSSGQSTFYSVAADSAGNTYAAGFIYGNTGGYSLSDQYSVTGVSSANNILLAKYSFSGEVLWAKTVDSSSCSDSSNFASVAFSKGSVYTGGYIANNLTFNFGNGITAAGVQSSNILLVRYR